MFAGSSVALLGMIPIGLQRPFSIVAGTPEPPVGSTMLIRSGTANSRSSSPLVVHTARMSMIELPGAKPAPAAPDGGDMSRRRTSQESAGEAEVYAPAGNSIV